MIVGKGKLKKDVFDDIVRRYSVDEGTLSKALQRMRIMCTKNEGDEYVESFWSILIPINGREMWLAVPFKHFETVDWDGE